MSNTENDGERYERSVYRLVAHHYALHGTGIPIEEVARVCDGEVYDIIEELRMCAEVYQIKPGLLMPVEKAELVELLGGGGDDGE